MNLPEEKFVMKKPSKYDLLKLAVAELIKNSFEHAEFTQYVCVEKSDLDKLKEFLT